MELRDLLSLAVKEEASDIHLKAGVPPMIRRHGRLEQFKDKKVRPLKAETLEQLIKEIMSEKQFEKFNQTKEADFSYGISGIGRFRVNASQQRGSIRLVFRSLSSEIPTLEELSLPPILKEISKKNRGLVLVTGATGNGKSTTLAALIDYINSERSAHIVTIEDPIEYVIPDKKGLVTQRELGTDTDSFSTALRSALRQDPDVIFVGEMRDLETVKGALLAAETGHLVVSTLHTSDAAETINRIISIYPELQQSQVRHQLGATLSAVISQRLARRRGGRGRIPAVEVLVNNARTREMIENAEKTRNLIDAIEDGYESYGMQSFDQSLMQMLTQGLIEEDEAVRLSSNPDNFKLRVAGVESMDGAKWHKFDLSKKDPFEVSEGLLTLENTSGD